LVYPHVCTSRYTIVFETLLRQMSHKSCLPLIFTYDANMYEQRKHRTYLVRHISYLRSVYGWHNPFPSSIDMNH